jgi:hypothetical protein
VRKVHAVCDALDGPYRFDAPDLLIGYEGGWRNSWDCATGSVSEEVFSDNTKSWSGDHCVDPSVVPGVIYANRPLVTETPRLIDVPFSIMRMFGLVPPRYMQGRMIFAEPGQEAGVRGALDPRTLDTSGRPAAARADGLAEAAGA